MSNPANSSQGLEPCEDILGAVRPAVNSAHGGSNRGMKSKSVLDELKEFEEEQVVGGTRKQRRKKRVSNAVIRDDPAHVVSSKNSSTKKPQLKSSSSSHSSKKRSSRRRSHKTQSSSATSPSSSHHNRRASPPQYPQSSSSTPSRHNRPSPSSQKRSSSKPRTSSRHNSSSSSSTSSSSTLPRSNGAGKKKKPSVARSATLPGVSSPRMMSSRTEEGTQFDDETIREDDIHRGSLVGERLLMKLEIKYLNPTYNVAIQGNLVMTNYQLFFEPSTHARLPVGDHGNVYVPLAAIDRIEQTGNERNDRSVYALDIYTRQYRSFRFLFHRGGGVRAKAYQLLMQYAFPPQLSLVFAFSHLQERIFSKENDGWKLYDPAREFRRMGLPNDQYKLTAVNAEYHLCPTYPRLLCVPKSVTEDTLWKIAEFRKRGRIPVLTWKHPASEAAIWRCSQPRVGVSSARSLEDEELLKDINMSNTDNEMLYIMDARPKLNAVGNRLAGSGYELTQHYGQCTIRFLNIENIHTMRECLQRLGKLLNRHKPSDDDFFSQLESTQHLSHIRELLHATFDMVSVIDRSKASIVSHCSDGWDRTTQLCSLTELCMDPYFRTMDGFFVLIEKEWLSYGHQFQTRTGHGDRDYTDDQRAPIFHQFIEAVWNLTEQFPLAFEFTSKMLVTLLDHLYSCRFGTFLYDSEQNRRKAKLAQSTVSLWTYLKCSEHIDSFLNPLYEPSFVGPVLYPTYSAKKITLWNDYFLRWFDHESLHGGIGHGSVPPYGASAATLLGKDDVIHMAVRKNRQRIDELEAILRRMDKERQRLQGELDGRSSKSKKNSSNKQRTPSSSQRKKPEPGELKDVYELPSTSSSSSVHQNGVGSARTSIDDDDIPPLKESPTPRTSSEDLTTTSTPQKETSSDSITSSEPPPNDPSEDSQTGTIISTSSLASGTFPTDEDGNTDDKAEVSRPLVEQELHQAAGGAQSASGAQSEGTISLRSYLKDENSAYDSNNKENEKANDKANAKQFPRNLVKKEQNEKGPKVGDYSPNALDQLMPAAAASQRENI